MSDEPTRVLQQHILDRLGSLETRMSSLEDRVEKRLSETRPIWERVLAELEGMRRDMDTMRQDVNTMRQDVNTMRQEMENGFRTLGKKTDILNREVFEVKADQQIIEDRVEKLEPKA